MNRAIEWFAHNHVAANLLMGLFVIGGFLTVGSIKQEVFPEISPDVVTVTVVYPGAAPEEVENGICLRVEEAIQGVEGLEKITSAATEGVGTVSVELVPGTSAAKALDEIKAVVDAIDTFPAEAEKPITREAVIRRQVIDVVISGETDERTLKLLGEQVRDELTALPGITHVDLSIARPYEISIEVSPTALHSFGLTFDEVARAVRLGSLDLPGGSVKTGGGEILLRTIGQAYRGEEFESLVLRTRPDGTRLVLGDVARIVDGFEDTGQEARFDGEPAVMVQVFRVGKQRATQVSAAVHDYVRERRALLPEGLSLTTWNDDAAILKSRLDLLIRNGRAGFVLVFLILALFLKLRLAFWVSLGIPISFLGAIWMMPVLGVSINLISLFAFIVVLGLAVDDAIVVGESIYHQMERRRQGVEAAIAGAKRVATPVVFAVLTTVAAFAPLLFLPGRTGKIWKVIPIIVIPVLVVSLIESMFVLPSHLSFLKQRAPAGGIRGAWDRLQGAFDRGLQRFIQHRYRPLLDVVLRWRYSALAAGATLFLLTAGLVFGRWVGFTFFPSVQADDVVALVTMPLGTPRESTVSALHRIEDAATQLRAEVEEEHGRGAFRHILTSIGEQPYRNRQMGPNASGEKNFFGEHLGEVNIELAPMEEMDLDGKAVARRWRELVGSIPDAVEVTFSSSLFTTGEAINIQLAASDLVGLESAADEVKQALAAFPGVYDITDTFRSGKQELKLSIKPEAEALGLTLSDLARQVRQAFYGEEAQRVQRGRDDVKVMVRFPERERRSLSSLENMRVRAPGGIEVPFSTVATVERGRGFSTIRRSDRQRVIQVTADVDLAQANANDVLASLAANDLPTILGDHPGVSYSLEGEQRQQNDTLAAIGRGFAVALFVIFALLAVPLRSYTQPIVIMAGIPFGFVGAVWGHILMGMDLTMLSMAGFVALSGVVVNDSLVMVDFVNRRRAEGASIVDAAREAGVARFRAILLTSLSTFAGVTPLLLERSLQAQFLKPLAVSLGFGVIFATVVILFLVPVLYLILHDLHGVGRTVVAWLRGRPLEPSSG